MISRGRGVKLRSFLYCAPNKQLKKQNEKFSVADAFSILKLVRQEGLWATRVSFVYSVKGNRVYYVLNNDFKNVTEYQFDRNRKQKYIAKKAC